MRKRVIGAPAPERSGHRGRPLGHGLTVKLNSGPAGASRLRRSDRWEMPRMVRILSGKPIRQAQSGWGPCSGIEE